MRMRCRRHTNSRNLTIRFAICERTRASGLTIWPTKRLKWSYFLRHAGCTFCRQTLADVASHRAEIEATGCGILLVHLGREDDQASIEVFQRYDVDDLPRISDPTSRLYRQFGLDLGGWSELFGLKVWLRGFLYGVVNGHGIGAVRGNSFQMPGVYLYHRGVILGGFRHASAADRPSYLELAQQIQLGEPESAEVSEAATARVE